MRSHRPPSRFVATLLVIVALVTTIGGAEAAFQPFERFKSLLKGVQSTEVEDGVAPELSNAEDIEKELKAIEHELQAMEEDGSTPESDWDTQDEVGDEEEDNFPSSYPNLDQEDHESSKLHYTEEYPHDQDSKGEADGGVGEIFKAAYSYSYNSEHPSHHKGLLRSDKVMAIETKMFVEGFKVRGRISF